MKRLIYLDNSATTKPCDEAIIAAENAMTENYGNPSSLYSFGMQAEQILSSARLSVADFLNAREDEIYFTSCGSESNNTAIFGAAQMLKRRGNHIVATSVEHPSVLEPLKRLEQSGFEVTYLRPRETGNINPEQFKAAIRKDTVLVCCMAVNNEVGSIFPFDKLKSIIKSQNSNALLFVDAVQAFGKLPIDVAEAEIDLMSASAHKIHGIKGSGMLFVKKNIHLPIYLYGGGQEKGLRSGTEAVPNIAAFGAAVKALPDLKKSAEKINRLNLILREKLSEFDNAVINSPENALPYILNFSFLGYRSETLLHQLEKSGVCVSSGSACSKGKGSYVLREMQLENKLVDSALRVSFSRFSDEDDVFELISALKTALNLRKSVK